MTREQERIRLAERMGWLNIKGWTESPMSGKHPYDRWYRRGEDKQYDYLPFNPFTDANDCEALIRHLNEAGYFLYVGWKSDAALAQLLRSDGEFVGEYAGNDWKQGVCELALKVLDND